MATKKETKWTSDTDRVKVMAFDVDGEAKIFELSLAPKAVMARLDKYVNSGEPITPEGVAKILPIRAYVRPLPEWVTPEILDEYKRAAAAGETNPFPGRCISRHVLEDHGVVFRKAAVDPAAHTVFSTGAYRDSDKDKIDFEGHLSPLTLMAIGRYMHKHRFLKDGTVRASDNWQLGFDDASFLKSGLRHQMNVWLIMRGHPAEESLDDALNGWAFNVLGLIHNREKRKIEAAGNRDADAASARPAA